MNQEDQVSMSKELFEHVKREESRLDRIEDKIDKLSEAMIKLARAEERMGSVEHNMNHHYDRMNRFSQRLDEVDNLARENAHTVNILNKITYVVVVALIGAIVKLYIG